MSSPVLYLAPRGDTVLQTADTLPPCPEGHLRVVCIADTHNEHEGLALPMGHILVHAGDILTESGRRHVTRDASGRISSLAPSGVALVDRFAAWLGRQPHPHKVVIGGNHDLVLAGLGAAAIRATIARACGDGYAIYLEHETATLGALRVFGSPRAAWGSKNDAFLTREPDFGVVQPDTHIVVTHIPAVLPSADDASRLHEDASMTAALHRARARLHVSGHCHWAHGVYRSSGGVPCAVASVSGSWAFGRALRPGPSGTRGDAQGDARYGGYNLAYPPIVCDVELPGGPPPPGAHWVLQRAADEVARRPRLLLFCPAYDDGTRARLERALACAYDVCHFSSASEAVAAVEEVGARGSGRGAAFAACVAKLGKRGNLGTEVIQALRRAAAVAPPDRTPSVVVVHSATAVAHPSTAEALRSELGVAAVVDHSSEETALRLLLAHVSAEPDAGDVARASATPPPVT